jgi:hypothetical protein
LVGEAEEAFAGGLLDGMQATGKQGAGVCHNDGYMVSVGAAEGGDSLLAEPRGRVPDAGIEEALLGMHGHCAVKSLTTGKIGECITRRRVESEAETLRRREGLAVDGGYAEIDLLAVLVANDIGVGGKGVDEAEGGSAHDAAIDDVGGLDAKVAY